MILLVHENSQSTYDFYYIIDNLSIHNIIIHILPANVNVTEAMIYWSMKTAIPMVPVKNITTAKTHSGST